MTLDLFARTLAAFEHHREAILAAIEKARTPSSSQSEGWGGRRQRLLPLQCTAIDAGGFGEGGRNVVFCHDGRVLWDVASMKTPVEVSDELYRRAKAEAGETKQAPGLCRGKLFNNSGTALSAPVAGHHGQA